MEDFPFTIEVVRKPIRRLHLRVYPGGRVVASVPWWTPRSRVEEFVLSQQQWLLQAYDRSLHTTPRVLPDISREQRAELEQYLAHNVELWRVRMGEAPVTWRLRNMKSQWGNCRAQRRLLTFNLQLARVPDDLRDYIIVHELSHLQVQNHGPLFKARQSAFLPDWPSRRRRLKAYV